ncbi:DEAD-box ATP-dependent RNA helicase CshA [Minicystis rosea]|nr:DEAD-box ATP-dependent RNA helicase CshA [Minicystis rosea]
MTDITPSPTASPAAPPAADAGPPSRSAATFEVLPLSRELRETLAEIGYTHPTPVQLAVWEPATRGNDAVVQARTGTGKTAAFGLPIVDHLVRKSMAQVQVLALCPTRELALQVTNEIERLGKRKNIKVAAIYGGAPMQRQIDQIADGAQVIVGTPGRVLDHLRRGTLDPKHIRLLVLDEADEMLSMGFEREVTAILDSLPKERQTLLFSATLPPDIERMAKKLRKPEYVTLSGDHVGALSIEHFVYFVAGDKLGALIRVIEVENPEGAVVFCNTKDETERVAQALTRQGYDADWLNGDLPQSDRERVMAKTREGRLRFLVATDVAARGIDISHLTHVINYDFPQDAESYVHRTGRTGRAGRTGTGISLITPHDVGGLYLLRLTYKIRPIEKQIPSEGELKTRSEADLVSMLAEAFTAIPVHADDLALARRLLTHENGEAIVAGLLRDHLGARPDAQREATAARKATRVPPKPAAPKPARTETPRAPKPEEAPTTTPGAQAAPIAAEARTDERPARAEHERREHGRDDRGERRGRGHESHRNEGERGQRSEGSRFESERGQRGEGERGQRFEGERGQRAEGERGERGQRAEGERGERGQRAEGERGERGQRAESDRGERGERGQRAEGDRGERGQRAEGDRGERGQRAEGGQRVENERGPRGRGRDRGERRGRGREEHVPVSAAQGTHEGDPSAVPTRHADFTTWQPPEEEGDDEPILGSEREARGRRRHAEPRPAPEANAPIISEPTPATEAAPSAEGDVDLAEIYVNIGRREGARAADFQRILTERAGLDKANVRRIRVRERNAFVSVRREDLATALAALTGATIAGKVASAEQARERGSEGEASVDAPRPSTEESSAASTEAAAVTDAATTDAATAAPAPEAPTDDDASDAAPTGRTGGVG